MEPEQIEALIRQRARWVGKSEMSMDLGIDRTTLWKREKFPDQAPEGFWVQYATALRRRLFGISEEVREAAADLVGAA